MSTVDTAPISSEPARVESSDEVLLSDFFLHLSPTLSTGSLFRPTTASTVLKFLVARGLFTGSSFFVVTAAYARRQARRGELVRSLRSSGVLSSSDEDDGTNPTPVLVGRAARPLLDALPAPGSYTFAFGDASREWRLDVVSPVDVHAPPQSYEESIVRKLDVMLTVRARNAVGALAMAEELFAAAADHAESLHGDPTKHVRVLTITGQGPGEVFSASDEVPTMLPKRPLATIYLPDSIKAKAREEIARFLREKADYLRFGIPYRRSMLLAGPPGLGKTSLVHALASEFNLPIYMVRIGPKSTDDGLAAALRGVNDKRGSLLVLEDVDALFTAGRKRDTDATAHAVSFSGLLNALDGLGAPSGVVLIMTTNHIDNLDPALLRPGRIDTVYTFASPTAASIAAMIAALVPSVPAVSRDALAARIRAEPACRDVSTAVLQKFLFDARHAEDLTKELPALINLCQFYAERAAAAHRKSPEGMFG